MVLSFYSGKIFKEFFKTSIAHCAELKFLMVAQDYPATEEESSLFKIYCFSTTPLPPSPENIEASKETKKSAWISRKEKAREINLELQ